MLRYKVAALDTQLISLPALTDTVRMLVSQVEKLDLQTASMRSETGKQAKLLAEVAEPPIRAHHQGRLWYEVHYQESRQLCTG